jgi:hypothetical protein
MQSRADYAVGENVCSTGANRYSGWNCIGANAEYISGGDALGAAADAAMMWWAQGGPSQGITRKLKRGRSGGSPVDPNGYLAFAINALNHAEDIASSSFACDQISRAGNCGRTAYDVFNPMLFNQIWTIYTLVRSQMTSEEITTFVNKMLNDNSTANNGIGGSESSPTTSCTVQTFTAGTGYISVAGNVVTGTGTSFTTQLAVGDVIFGGTGGARGETYSVGSVYQIVSDTKVILTTNNLNAAGGAWSFTGPWAPGDCGLLWLQKHHGSFPRITPGQSSACNADYPTSGCNVPADDENITSMALSFAIRMGLALADDDTRAGTLLTNAFNYYYAYMYPKCKQGWDGFNQGGNQYGVGTWGETVPEIAVAVRNSVSGGAGSAIDLTSGYYLSRYAPLMYYGAQAGTTYTGGSPLEQSMVWGDGTNATNARAMHNLRAAFTACYITGGPTGTPTPDCQGFNYYLRTLRGDYNGGGWGENGGSYAWQFYMFYNYNGAAATPGTQYVFKDNDITYAQCAATFTGLANVPSAPGSTNVDPCTANQYWGGMFSLSDWTTHATQLLVKSGWDMNGQDHTTNLQQGGFHILKNATYLLAGDGGNADGYWNYGPTLENMIDLNGTFQNGTFQQATGGNANGYYGQYVPIIRWTSTDPTGDTSSRYAYEMLDLYNGGNGLYGAPSHATRVQRQIVHFKKSGGQDYIVTWDDIALSSAIAIGPKAYFHYYLNRVPPATAISYNGADYTVSNLQKSRGALLNSKFIPTAGANTAALVIDNPNGRYKGGSGSTYRAYMCPSTDGTTINNSATSGEWAGVFQPINGTNGSMPTIDQLTPTESAKFRVIQIADSTWPKVAYFATGGSTSNSALHVTTTYSGTGQNLITGLATGTATVTVGGTPVTGSPFMVNAGDNTVYWEGAAGAVVVTDTPSGHR